MKNIAILYLAVSLFFLIPITSEAQWDDATNMKLSEERAKAVADQLVSMGIEAGRLEPKGMGESQPVDSNNTPEGKANNRRVEFIKI